MARRESAEQLDRPLDVVVALFDPVSEGGDRRAGHVRGDERDGELVIGADAARPLFGDAELTASGDVAIRVRVADTGFAAWALPGLRAPSATERDTPLTPEAFVQLGGPAGDAVA
mgnify:CR=1 FL=1